MIMLNVSFFLLCSGSKWCTKYYKVSKNHLKISFKAENEVNNKFAHFGGQNQNMKTNLISNVLYGTCWTWNWTKKNIYLIRRNVSNFRNLKKVPVLQS